MQADPSQPLITHLIELRNRLLRSLICVLVVFCVLVYWANDIYTLLATPLISNLPQGADLGESVKGFKKAMAEDKKDAGFEQVEAKATETVEQKAKEKEQA